MKHPDEEQLIALYYGDARRPEALNEHLRACSGCRENFSSLQQTLGALKNAPVPERGADYGSQVWYAFATRLDRPEKLPARRHRVPWDLRRLAWAGTLAAMIVAAFFAGRYWPRRPIPMVASNPAQTRQGVLLVAVSDHLDHAQMVLMELANGDSDGSKQGVPKKIDIAIEQERAQQLLVSNRLYEQTAQETGDAEIENILNALEPVLLEIAHSPGEISSQQLQQIQGRISNAGILFKVRVVSSDVRNKERSLARQKVQGQT
ncbi:MAG: anti-sigma factor family protein [Candidatus Acidiferrales bacterium]